ncbi:hypothetical protein ASPZODRAFT_154360 [Penicilliopsis zonata CBS 506.65]|uniref:DNA (cytosine-5-)-methyltransferase n=1 Tax=Penicilliopsis zonata CBS 506.65 TaxID=1073090 RepID=A0A1L9S9Q6_9EURO|nr:hypothetical protein ASPZODRAFT_154360 [Penicilliopsis zonata CBS 506.65]OJJ43859.1 hypothetical protein ASPZODRAFT_154360 [Penicilliopsis zonata CBS 506.65]
MVNTTADKGPFSSCRLLCSGDLPGLFVPSQNPSPVACIDAIDLDPEPEISFTEGDYLSDENLAALLRTWGESVSPELPAQIEHTIQSKIVVEEACIDGIVYKKGLSVELHEGTYLRILAVLQGPGGEIFLRGRRLVKLKDREEGPGPSWRREVLWVVNHDTTEVPLAVVQCFCIVHFTNWPDIKTDTRSRNARYNELFCRLKETDEGEEMSMQYLHEDEADEGFQFSPDFLRQQWRGDTFPFGGSRRPPDYAQATDIIEIDMGQPGEPLLIDLESDTSNHRQYTFGDAFCGAGGVSCGAEQAGLAIQWAFDKNEHAMSSYQMNFPTVWSEQADIFDLLTQSDSQRLKVDISHGSPPCQTFSPAHTINGPNDDANSACIFSCADLVRKVRPRVHTMEETCGLYERHKETFHRVILDFIEVGYSVRWGILNCMLYGVPQTRRRLIIIASGPGESLPRLPKPTHAIPGSNSGLLDRPTIHSAISSIPLGTRDHDVDGALARGLRYSRPPFNADQPAGTITCNGGERNYHPSGTRGFTNREFASLQTFPLHYRFGDREVRKQIGNAVPPILARAIYREIIKTLRKTDARASAEKTSVTI